VTQARLYVLCVKETRSFKSLNFEAEKESSALVETHTHHWPLRSPLENAALLIMAPRSRVFSLEWLEELCQRCKANDARLTDICLDPKDGSVVKDQHLLALSDALRKNTHVKALSLGNITMSQQASISFCTMIQRSNIRSLYFEDCEGDDGTVAIALSLSLRTKRKTLPSQSKQQQQQQTLQSLHLNACQMTIKSASALGLMLSINQTLTELRICHCDIFSTPCAQALAQGIQSNPTLQILDLLGNSLNDEHLQVLCHSVATSAVELLIFDFNNFGSEGLTSVADMLRHRDCQVQEMHLFGNHITASGAKQLAKGLTDNIVLHTLILSLNQIGDEGMQSIFQALTINCTLRKLWAPSNRITNQGIFALAQYLPRMKGLAQLNLGDHIIDECAVRAVLDALPHNMHLTTLYVESPVFYIMEEQQEQDTLEEELDYWLSLNQCGRRLLQSTHCNFMRGLWPRILAKAVVQPSRPVALLYALLREKPDLFC
jgi:Ran GTPase-activating protein (RanGAP) involved in mRNA processing and transport